MDSVEELSGKMYQSLINMQGEQPLSKAIEYCPDCGYSLRSTPCGFCEEARRRKDYLGNQQKDVDTRRLGGIRAYEDFTLEKFDNEQAKKACADFPNCNLFIYGSAGTGKTHLATALIREYAPFLSTKPQQIFRRLRDFQKEVETQVIADYVNTRSLLIDDLGTEKVTDFSFSATYEIIDGRWMAKKNGLIITSNLSTDSLVRHIGDRIPSRIAGMCRIIKLEGRDRRL